MYIVYCLTKKSDRKDINNLSCQAHKKLKKLLWASNMKDLNGCYYHYLVPTKRNFTKRIEEIGKMLDQFCGDCGLRIQKKFEIKFHEGQWFYSGKVEDTRLAKRLIKDVEDYRKC